MLNKKSAAKVLHQTAKTCQYVKENAENVIFSAFLYDLWGMDSVFTIILLGLAPFLLSLLLFREKKGASCM